MPEPGDISGHEKRHAGRADAEGIRPASLSHPRARPRVHARGSDAEGLEKSRRNKKKRTKVYYCHPYSSCERGSNENANRLIRRHIPKGVNFDKKSKTEIKEIETWINNYPRKIFEYDTAENQFINEMEKLTG